MLGHARRLLRGGHFGEQWPVRGRCFHFELFGAVFGDVVVEAVFLVPVVGIHGCFDGIIFRLPFGSDGIFADAFSHTENGECGEALLSNGIHP